METISLTSAHDAVTSGQKDYSEKWGSKMPRRKRQKREYAHQGSTLWIDDETGNEFYREPSWKPTDSESKDHFGRPRKWRKLMDNW